MYTTFDSGETKQPSGLRRLARRDLPGAPRAAAAKPAAEAAPTPINWPTVTVFSALSWLRRGLLWIVVLAVIGTGAGLAYALLAKPKFTASTDMIIDPSSLQVMSNDLYQNPLDQNAQLLDVESKLRVLTSGNVLKRVVEQLNLTADPEFTVQPSLFDFSFLGTGSKDAASDPELGVIDALDKRVAAWREERSYVVTLSVSTEDPDKSVKIADAIVAAFQAELAKGEADGAARAAASLMDRLGALQDDVTTAEAAVEVFKKAHNLQETNGELVNSQSATQINKSTLDAQQALIAAQSHYSELTDPKTGKANADAVQTQTMTALRAQYGILKQQADAAATLYGPLHPNRTSVDRQLGGLQAQIDAEANRAVQSAKLDLAQAQRTVDQLNQQNTAALTTVSTDDAAQVQLNNLERDAKAKSDVYEAFLTRAHQVAEQQQLDTSNIRIISPATPPVARSWPPRGVITAGVGGVAGLMLGLALALALGWAHAFRQARKAD